MEITYKELPLISAEIHQMFNELFAEQAEISRLYSDLQKNAAAPVPDAPTPTESRPLVPESIARLAVSADGFDPFHFFTDFFELMHLVHIHRCKISYSDFVSIITSSPSCFSEMTVHQIVSAVYQAANKEQSK